MRHKQYVFRPNTLYHGDCLEVMRKWEAGCVDLIYLDPPFNSNANYNVIYGKDQKGMPLDERAQFLAFGDTWYWGREAAERVQNMKNAVGHPAHKAICGLSEMLPEGGMFAYLSYMAERLAMMKRVLKDTGSIYLHCDPTASHYLKTVMDCVFGAANFRNEIVWCYSSTSQAQRWYPKKHDIIFWYSKAMSGHSTPTTSAFRFQSRLLNTEKLGSPIPRRFWRNERRRERWRNLGGRMFSR